MGLLFGKKKPKPESKYDGNVRRYDKEFKVYERIVHDDLRFDKNDTEREIQKRWIEYETRPNQFKWDYERVVEAERWLKVDEEGISTHPDRFTEGYMAETPEAYQKRMEYTEKIREHIKSVLNKEGDDPSLTPYERMFHRQYYAKARRVKKIADFTNQDYAIIRESIRDFYDYYKGENHCIITPNYVIEAWLLIAQHVFYDNEEITIPLDPQLTARENAQKHFDKYNKLKRTYEALSTLTKETFAELSHLESVSNALEIARDENDLAMIKEN